MNLLLACLAGGLVSVVVRAVWYHPSVFGAVLEQDTNSQSSGQMATFAASFVICAYLSYEMKWVNHPDDLNFFLHGMYHGARNIGVFAAGAIIVHAIAEHKSGKYILVNASYWLITLALIGGVLASFPSFRPKKADTETSMTIPYEAPLQQESIVHLG
jgi:hypothetical protein